MVKHVRYSDADLQEFKSLIENKLDKARTELKYLYDQIVGAESNGDSKQNGDYFDSSSRHIEMEMLNKMASRQRMFIRNLENALLRIKNKSYGICSITGELICKERLLLVPHATKSVAGKHNAPGTSKKRVAKPPSSTNPKRPNKKIVKKSKYTKDQITSNPEEEEKDIEFLEMPRNMVDLDMEDYIDFN